MEKISIKKTKKYNNGSVFEFRYEGIPFPIFEQEKVEKLLDEYLNNEEQSFDMAKKVSYIRTILETTKEELLVVEYKDSKNSEIVKYDNNVLFLYESKKYNDDNLNYIKTEYTPGRGLNVSFSDFGDTNILDCSETKNVKDYFNELIDNIELLKKAKRVCIDNDSLELIAIYKLFYNENPDFSKKETNIKTQAMMSILAQFGIKIWESEFEIIDDMPQSPKLLQIVNKLSSLGEISVVDHPVKFYPDRERKIKIVMETIRESINDKNNLYNTLIAISKTVYAGNYNMSSMYNIEKIIDSCDLELTYKEAESSADLIKIIKHNTY